MPYFPITLAPCILFYRSLFQEQVLFWGVPSLQFIPWQALAAQIISSGQIPLWNPYNGLGAPLLANYQVALFYPLNWPLFLVQYVGNVSSMAWAQTIIILIHIIISGVGMAKLSRKLGVSRFGQTVSSVSFELCGYVIARAAFFPMVRVFAWIPWLLFLIIGVTERGDKKSSGQLIDLKVIFVLCMTLLAGHAQLAYYSMVISFVWCLWWAISKMGFKGVLFSLIAYASNLLPSLLLSAIQIFPTAEYLMLSYRAEAVDFATAMRYSFWPWHFFTLLVPEIFGSPGTGNYWGYAAFWEDQIYIGLIPFFLALLSPIVILISPLKRLKKFRVRFWIFFWLTIPIAILLALGQFTPIFPLLYQYIPTFDMFQAPTRFMIWIEIALTVLAGLSVDLLRPIRGRLKYWLRLGTAAGVAIILGCYIGKLIGLELDSSIFDSVLFAGGLCACFGLLCLFRPKQDNGKRLFWEYIFISVVMCDLIIVSWDFNPTIRRSFFDENFPESVNLSSVGDHRLFMYSSDEYDIKHELFFTFDDFSNVMNWNDLAYSSLPDINLLAGSSLVNNFDPLIPERFKIWFDGINSMSEEDSQIWLKYADVKAILKAEHYENRTEPYHIQQFNISGASRIWWFPCWQSVKNSEDAINSTISILQKVSSNSMPEVIIVEDGSNSDTTTCVSGSKANFELISSDSNSVEFRLTNNNSGWVMLSDTCYPGWEAYVDGVHQDIRCADYIFKAIFISEPGDHIIRFTYLPMSFYSGASISLVAFAIVSYWTITKRRKREIVKIKLI
jgi:hypothetical protein